MAKTHFSNCYLAIDNAAGTPFDFTDYVEGIDINKSREELNRTYAGCVGRARGAGLHDWEITAYIWNDFADDTVDETINGIVSAGTVVTVTFRPSSDAASANNPEYAGEGICLEHPIPLKMGEDNMLTITIRGADGAEMTRSTS